MRKSILLGLIVVLSLGLVAVTYAGARGHMELAAGDEVYACDCGPECPCDTLSNKEGDCTCGKPMVKAKAVADASDGKVALEAEGWESEKEFKTHGKYVCACPPECPCDTQSQNPGKCVCGVDMKAVEG